MAYLNNKRVFEWLGLNGIVKGAIVEFSEAPIASIPFRPINWNSEDEVKLHNQITDEVKKYLQDGKDIHLSKINNFFDCIFNG